MTARRELRLAVLLCLAGAALVLLAVGRPWLTFSDPQQLTISSVERSLAGSRLAPGARALGLVGLAGVVALAATRRWGRVVVGALVALAGAGVLVAVARVLGESSSELAARHADGSVTRPHLATGWPVVCVLGGVLLVLSGLLVAARGRRWAALSSSYEVPAAREAEPTTDKAVWDALDQGHDPTG